jgi:hypothetical protein
MKISIIVRNEDYPPKIGNTHIIGVWNQMEFKPTTFSLSENDDFSVIGEHIKSIIQSYSMESLN